ncbi:MAG: SUMF1/EgtB/PvdO family nonheme iron enzyme, partial [Opitutales bacterium]|nr:SUMF1/EgtB/PvdO family nonheme iron enzyme [Opitutales bacterium]
EPTAEDMDKLEKSIEILSRFIKQSESPDRDAYDELALMRTILQNTKARREAEEIDFALKKADEAFTRHELMDALKYYRQAYELQSRINNLYPDSDYRDVMKLEKANQMLRLVSAAPFAKEIKDIQAKIKEEVELKHWQEAKILYKKAIDIQNLINKEYSNTSYADFSKVRDFEIELESLNAAPLKSEIDESVAAGKKCEAEKKFLEAAEFYRKAVDKQAELNANFERSAFASGERLSQLKVLQDIAMSRPLFDDISEMRSRLQAMLREGQPCEKILPLAENILIKCDSFKAEHPLSNLLKEETVLSLRYIGYLGKNLQKIHEYCAENLLSFGDSGSVKMLRTEVPQYLYELVMQENPSRNRDPQNPVETVSYENAQDFCRRLSWILARKVSLPTVGQYKTALGSLKYADINSISWNAGNSDMRTRHVATKEPNIKGFYDLLGNVGEYSAPGEDGMPSVFGGNAQTWTDAISDIPAAKIQTTQRGDRNVGFRFVVDFSAE